MSHDPTKAGKQPVRLGKYEVLSRIGKGGMGTVYRAIDTDLQRLVALKIMSKDMAANPVMVERFRREARSAAKLKHENIVSLYDFGEVQGNHFLAMEFVDGKDLHHFVARKGKLDPVQARDILIQAARALDHAHRQGIVHRDIKPANFLISELPSGVQVKLTDMGLALIRDDRDAKLTKDHTTVGTVDYMAPEQAHNSRAADVRSDIYSLGCTFYHMLAGHCPFPEGSIPERIVAHFKTDPPDIRELNGLVPDDLVRILEKMLAKKPSERYQTPAALLSDLETPEVVLQPLERSALEELARDEEATEERVARRERDIPAPSDAGDDEEPDYSRERRKRRRDEEDDEDERPEDDAPAEDDSPQVKKKTPVAAYALAGGAVVAVVLGVWFLNQPGPAPKKEDTDKKGEDPPTPIVKKEKPPPIPPVEKERPEFVGPAFVSAPPLYAPTVPIDRAALRLEVEEGIAPCPAPAVDAAVIVWKRPAENVPGQARTLAAAIAQAGEKKQIVVDIQDNGPLWVPSQELGQGRTVYLRAGVGFRPLIAWDMGPAGKGQKSAWLQMEGGALCVEGIDFVFKRPDDASGQASVFHLKNASFFARDCTFSITGKDLSGLALLVADAVDKTSVRLSHCFVRAADMKQLVLRGAVETAIEDSLLAGGEEALISVESASKARAGLRLVRSSLVCARNALSWQVNEEKGEAPTLPVLAWDSIVARSDEATPQGDMVLLRGAAHSDKLRWRPVNTIYAGWKQLLSAPDRKIPSGSIKDWRGLASVLEGDLELNETWPPRVSSGHGDAPVDFFQTRGTSAYFAATGSTGTVGASVAAVPPGPEKWALRTYEPHPIVTPALLDEAGPPVIPGAADGLYHGEKIDLGKVDLGAHLASVFKAKKAAPKVILHLTGKGKAQTTPIVIRDIKHLVLYFDQTAKAKEEPLTLVVKPSTLGKEEALLDMQDGVLEIVQGRFFFVDSRAALCPPYVLRASNVELRLRHCVFQGPYDKAPEGYRGLLYLQSNREDEKPAPLVVQDCVFQGGRKLMHVEASNLALRFKNNLFYAGEEALHLHASDEKRPRLFLTLENNTCVARRQFLTLSGLPRVASNEAIAIHAVQNYLVHPFGEDSGQPVFLGVSPEEMAAGGLVWEGRGNALEKGRWETLWAFGLVQAKLSDWQSWWGRSDEGWKLLERAATSKDFPLETPVYERLLPPPPYRIGMAPPYGADLVRLGLLKKKV